MKRIGNSETYMAGCKAVETRDCTRADMAAPYQTMGRDDDAERLAHRLRIQSLEAARTRRCG